VILINAGRVVFDGEPARLLQHGATLDDAFQTLTGAAMQ